MHTQNLINNHDKQWITKIFMYSSEYEASGHAATM